MEGVPKNVGFGSEDGEKAGCVLHCGGWCLALALTEWKGGGAAGAGSCECGE